LATASRGQRQKPEAKAQAGKKQNKERKYY